MTYCRELNAFASGWYISTVTLTGFSMSTVVNLLPKLRWCSVKISTMTALALLCTACSDATWLYFALAFPLLPPSPCSIALVCYYIHHVLTPVMEREAGRPELLHVSGQRGSVGSLWGELCWGGRSCKVGWYRRRPASCCSLLQGMMLSQASDQLESGH